ncbi:MAG: alpha/beta hydrolase [Promethearchaeota archaeon]
MLVFNRNKIRKEVLEVIDHRYQIQMKGIQSFIGLEENQGIHLQDYFLRFATLNKEFYERLKNGANSVKELYKTYTYEDQVLLAKIFRYVGAFIAEDMLKKNPIPNNILVESINLNGLNADWNIYPGVESDSILLYFHGGGNVMLSSKTHRLLTIELAKATKLKVLSVNYRLAPEHPFPAALDDCFSSYNWLLEQGYDPKNIVIGGDSAGGNYTIALLLRLKEKKIALPVGAFAISPILDYTLSSKTMYENRETDPILADSGIFWWDSAYLAGADPTNPLISPIFGDLRDLPPILLQVSKIEMLYDHSTRFAKAAKKAGTHIILQEWDDMPHAWHGFNKELPEAKEAIEKIGIFVKSLFV